MTLTLHPAHLAGDVTLPPSKSQAHRLLIAAYLAGGTPAISNLAQSNDIIATTQCMERLIGHTNIGEEGPPVLHCGESGSTLRFLIPVALALHGCGIFTGEGRLMERPQDPYFALFREKGIVYSQRGGFLTVMGALTSGTYALPGNVSSQFVTGLLYALPLLAGDSFISLTSPLESKGYVDMTLDALAQFGVVVEEVAGGYRVPGGQSYTPASATVEGDYSQAGFYCAANGIGHTISLHGLNPKSRQGDKIILDYAARLMAGGEVTLDVSQCPDLVPALAVACALRAGEVSHIVGAARLRIKESDRLAAVTQTLNTLGANVVEGDDYLTITGVSALTGGVVSSFNDHRIAMMLAIAATRATAPVVLEGAESVAKSYPNFWEDYAALGGIITE